MSEGKIDAVKPSCVAMWLSASRKGGRLCRKELCPYVDFFNSLKHVVNGKMSILMSFQTLKDRGYAISRALVYQISIGYDSYSLPYSWKISPKA